ncbi:hypothetical protein Y032_0519g2837 [Ancylostoma ceylanicum]|uniref:DDE Tnp4 domain-containing protein n=1 Tax=Ancylostoma ceylanicum TaxID=53326 RepID=A0A016WU31_9BILA|nr:hypothetical protein Y032_0519g2837 [Ancylostoma ceylanicum]
MVVDNMKHETSRGYALGVQQLVAMCFNLLARSTKQRNSAGTAGCDQETVSSTLVRFVDAIRAKAGTAIYWPSDAERRRVRKRIFDSYHLHNIVGFIDGSHIRILGPEKTNQTTNVQGSSFRKRRSGLQRQTHLSLVKRELFRASTRLARFQEVPTTLGS